MTRNELLRLLGYHIKREDVERYIVYVIDKFPEGFDEEEKAAQKFKINESVINYLSNAYGDNYKDFEHIIEFDYYYYIHRACYFYIVMLEGIKDNNDIDMLETIIIKYEK